MKRELGPGSAQIQFPLEVALEVVPSAMVVANTAGTILLVNRHAEQLFGYASGELIGQSIECLVPVRWQELHRKQRSEFHSHPRTRLLSGSQTVWGICRDGREVPLAIGLSPLETENETLVVAALVDLTARRCAEEALVQEKERAQVTLEAIGDAVVTTDASGHIAYLNPVAEAFTGWSLEEARSRPVQAVLNIVHEKTRRPIPRLLSQCMRSARTPVSKRAILISRGGQEYAVESSVSFIRDRKGVLIGLVVVFRDVTEAQRITQEMIHQATHDALTGLVNRRAFEQRLCRVLKTAHAHHNQHALCYLDLDQFKLINDTCGHVAGDVLLSQLATLLSAKVRKRDTLARLGGDEFGILMELCTLDQACRVVKVLKKTLEDFRFIWEGKAFGIGASFGLVPITPASDTVTSILQAADTACYLAKEQGRNRVHVLREDDAVLATRHREMQWVTHIPWALEANRLQICFQPIVPVATSARDYHHFELLLRMEDAQGQLVPPGAFLPVAERYHLAAKLDAWVITTALKWLTRQPQYLQRLNLCAINLSGLSLGTEEFLPFVEQQLKETQVPPEKICFEITETAAIANLPNACRIIDALRQRGCRFALDDFGSGLSCFAYLKNLPVDFLKIDGAFIKDIVSDPIDFAMVKSIHDIGHVMGKQTIAEFVENEQVLSKLREIGIDYGQGYYLGAPRPLEEMDSIAGPL